MVSAQLSETAIPRLTGRAGLAPPLPAPGAASPISAPGSHGRQAVTPALRLTRRGRRVVAALSVATGLGIAVLTAATLTDGYGNLQVAGQRSVVVEQGDTLWSIAVSLAPEDDPRALVDAIQEANRLPNADLVPGQILRLP